MTTRLRTLKWAAASVAALFAIGMTPAMSAEILIGLITKTNNNPFFVKMKEGAEAKAKELGVTLQSFAGKYDGDNETQVAAVESLISAGAKGILITPSDTKAIVPTIEKARKAGILVIALDTPLDPIDAADATFATDNFKAGELIGEWAAKTLGDKAKDAHVAFLDALENQPTVDVARDQGFMKGFGIDIMDPKHYGEETDPRIAGHQWGKGAEEGGRTGMENLLQKDPDISRRLHDQRADRGRRLRGAEGRGQGERRADDLGRRRLPGRQEHRGGRDRGDLDAVPAADGVLGCRGGHRVRQDRQEAGAEPRPRLLQYRRHADHRQAGQGHRLDHGQRGPEEVLGLIAPPVMPA